MRPHYESDEDRFAEKRFADLMLSRLGAEFIKLPEHYIVDFVVKKQNRIIGYAEFKRRKVRSDKYNTVILALSKWMKLCEYSLYGGAWFWVQYDDCIKWIKVDNSIFPLPLDINIAGRTDRGDKADLEPCIHIPISSLHGIRQEEG